MTDEDRPYQYVSERSIWQEIRSWEKGAQDWSRKASRLNRQGIWDDANECSGEADRCNREAAKYYRELKIREEARKAKAERQSAGSRSGGLMTVACKCHPVRRFKLTQRAFERGPILCGLCNQPFQQAQ